MNTSLKSGSSLAPKQVFADRALISVGSGAIFVYGRDEDRSQVEPDWLSRFDPQNIYEVWHTEDISTARIPRLSSSLLSLRNKSALSDWIRSVSSREIFIDITGLAHHVWMPIVKASLEGGATVKCIYTEPAAYRLSRHPRPGEFYDLSEEVRGLLPIPTFSRLPSRRQEPSILVASLGFEGVRFRFIVEKIEPDERNLIPVVGVPGFEVSYPFESYEGNAGVLSTSRSWQRLEFADAACPFAMIDTLKSIRDRNRGRPIQIATIGTKPHALGAMLFSLRDPDCELLFDHPKKRRSRTTGKSKIHLYDLYEYRA